MIDVLFAFDGRINRRTQLIGWGAQVVIAATVVVLVAVDVSFGLWAMFASYPVATWIGLAVMIKRLHDLGLSAWYVLMVFIPLVGFVMALIWIFSGGHPRENEYGPKPKGWEVGRWRSGPATGG